MQSQAPRTAEEAQVAAERVREAISYQTQEAAAKEYEESRARVMGILPAQLPAPRLLRLQARQLLHEALASLANVEQGLRLLGEQGWQGSEEDPGTCGATLEVARGKVAEGYRSTLALAGLLAPRA